MNDEDVAIGLAFMKLSPARRRAILRAIEKELLRNKLLHGGRINEPVDQAPAPAVKPVLRVVKGGAR